MRGILLRGPRAIRSLFTEAAASSRPPRIAAAEPSRNHTGVRVQFAPTPNSPISSSSSSAYQVELHRDWITDNSERIQLVATRPALRGELPADVGYVPFGEAQRPPLDWQADGIDTLAFLRTVRPR